MCQGRKLRKLHHKGVRRTPKLQLSTCLTRKDTTHRINSARGKTSRRELVRPGRLQKHVLLSTERKRIQVVNWWYSRSTVTIVFVKTYFERGNLKRLVKPSYELLVLNISMLLKGKQSPPVSLRYPRTLKDAESETVNTGDIYSAPQKDFDKYYS